MILVHIILVVTLSFILCDIHIDTVNRLTRDLLGDNIGNYFIYSKIDSTSDKFELSTDKIDNNIYVNIKGNNGISLSSGLYWYLKYYLNSEVTWGYDETWKQINVTLPLIEIKNPIIKTNKVKYRYYLNVCTPSYTMAFWDIKRWNREIDWAAMNGINIILTISGQEYIILNTFLQLGLTEEEIMPFFSGPAFLAWNRMGNIKNFPSHLDRQFIEDQMKMTVQIVERMRSFGIKAILPAFAGFVPDAFSTRYPDVSTLASASWCDLNRTYSYVTIINPIDPYFTYIGKVFIENVVKVYGSDGMFTADTFNEIDPPFTDLDQLKKAGSSLVNSIIQNDPNGIWVMQAWLFLSGYWSSERVETYLSDVPTKNMLILDLEADTQPIWSRHKSFFGKEFVFNILHNYGGRRQMYGSLDRVVKTFFDTLNNQEANIVGIGITMEAIDQNPVVYELTLELPWRDENIDIREWLHLYGLRRSGYAQSSESGKLLMDAWDHLYSSIYNDTRMTYYLSYTVLSQLPGPNSQQDLSGSNVSDVINILKLMNESVRISLSESKRPGEPFINDFIDVCRQMLANLFGDVAHFMGSQYQRRDINSFKRTSQFGLEIIQVLDGLLNTNINYMIGPWIRDAIYWGYGDIKREEWMMFNAKLQVSSWVNLADNQLHDYSVKHWSGLMIDYTYKRWELFAKYIIDDLSDITPYDQSKFHKDSYYSVEEPFFTSNKKYSDIPLKEFTFTNISYIIDKYTNYNGFDSNYITEPGTDYPNNDLLHGNLKSWTTDINQMAMLCDLDDGCVGFNSNGFYKSKLGDKESSPANFYIKKNRK